MAVAARGRSGTDEGEPPFSGERAMQLLAWVAGGLIVGALLRPNPIGGLELAWVQIAQLLFEKTSIRS